MEEDVPGVVEHLQLLLAKRQRRMIEDEAPANNAPKATIPVYLTLHEITVLLKALKKVPQTDLARELEQVLLAASTRF